MVLEKIGVLGMDIFRCYRISIFESVKMKKLVYKSSVILLLLALCLGVYIYHQIFSSLTKSDKIILVPTGTSYNELKDTLRSNNLLKNEVVFDVFCSKEKLQNNLSWKVFG